MGARIREKDWAATSLGAPEHWPQSLKTAVRIMLTSRQPMFVWWGPELINLYNDAYKAIVGGKHPSALGQPAVEVWREIWDQVAPRAESALFKNEGTYDESLQLIMERYGYPEETYYTFSYSPVPNDDGSVGGIICANSDDTARIIGERQLALLRELAAVTTEARMVEDACTLSTLALRTNIHDLPFALIYLVTGDRLVLCGTSGIDPEHPLAAKELPLDGGSVWPLGDVLASTTPQLIRSLEGIENLPLGAWFRPPRDVAAVPLAPSGSSGQAGVLIVGLNPFRLFDPSYQGFLGLVGAQIAASISSAQAYEFERRRAESLAELDRAKTVFFSNVSHEFRTPLTLMLGPLEDLLARPAGEALNREPLEVVHRNARRLLKLVNSLLDFSRLEAGRAKVCFRPVDLAGFTADIASVFRSAMESAGLRFEVDCPPLAEPVYVDPEMWEKIVLNLLSNAFKFTLHGAVSVSLRAENGRAVLRVADTGAGIPESEMSHVFDRFHRVEGVAGRTIEGTGIGLAMVAELARLHGGSVGVESEIGRGSTFTISLPIGRVHLPGDLVVDSGVTPPVSSASVRSFADEIDALEEGSSIPLVPPAPGGHLSARILVADDNTDMRDYIRRLLGTHYEVVAVANGARALEEARRLPPDLVISDVMMPELDGFGLLKELRRSPETRHVPLILLSARAGEEARVDGLEQGADDYLTKPFSARELLARVGTLLEISRVRREAQEQITRTLESITDGLITLDGQWNYIYVNAEAERLLGYPREELLGQSLWQKMPFALGAQLEHVLREAVARQQTCEFRVFSPLLERWYDNKAYPTADGGVSIYLRDATERIAAQRDQTLLAAIVESSDDAILSKNLNGTIMSWNKGAERLFGYSPAEAIGRSITMLLPPECVEEEREIMGRLRRGERIDHIETTRVAKDGRRLTVALTVSPIRDANGIIVGASKVARDVTDRKKAEAEIAAAHETLGMQVRTLATLHDLSMKLAISLEIPDALGAVMGALGELLQADAAMLSLYEEETGRLSIQASFGLEKDALSRFHQRPVTEPEGLCALAFTSRSRVIDEDLAADDRLSEPYRELMRDLGLASGHSIPIFNRKGDILGVVTLFHRDHRRPTSRETQLVDLCARHASDAIENARSQQALRESEQFYRAIGESIDYGIWVCDAEGGYVYASDSFLQLIGLPQEECERSGWITALPPEEREKAAAAWRDCVNRGEQWDYEQRVQGVDGRLHPVLSRGVPVRDDHGKIIAWVGINLDISRLKQVEDELRLVDHRKDEFLAMLAHELRNPLAPLRNGLEIIRLAGHDPQIIGDARAIMERQLAQMVHLVDDLLDVSRISRGKIELRRQRVALGDILRSAVETSRPLVDESRHALALCLPDQPIVIEADVTRLSQVFANLLNNAARYTRPGGEIRLEARQQDGQAVITVSDNGIGIPAEMLPRVFDMFTQVDRSLERSQGGLGIGLSIARQLVVMHGGSIRALSDGSDRGTTMEVILPVCSGETQETAPAKDGTKPSSGQTGRILVADDNHDSAASLAMMLEILGYQVRVASDGEEAVALAGEFQPEIVLLDIGMPRLNGYDACRQIRRQPWAESALIIALTGWGQEDARALSRSAGFSHHLVKPVDFAELSRLLAEFRNGATHSP